MSQLVIGAGEVGTALAKVLGCPIRDMESPEKDTYRDVLHIAFPWSAGFVQAVRDYEDTYDAALVIVHSTVPVGTCDPQGWVHSPVRGRHPDLALGLQTFVKHFGGAMAGEAADLWLDRFPLGHDGTLTHTLAATTEAGKLWELATYGVEIAMQKRIKAWCERNALNFDEVYSEFGQTYNDGWHTLGETHLMKRLIRHEPGPIGGHCVTQNAPLLGEGWLYDMLAPHSPDGVWE